MWQSMINTPFEIKLLILVIVTVLCGIICYEGWVIKRLTEKLREKPNPHNCPDDSDNNCDPSDGVELEVNVDTEATDDSICDCETPVRHYDTPKGQTEDK